MGGENPRLFPKFNGWREPVLPFSFRTVLKREHTGFFAVITIFTFLEIIGDYFVKKIFEFDTAWRSSSLRDSSFTSA